MKRTLIRVCGCLTDDSENCGDLGNHNSEEYQYRNTANGFVLPCGCTAQLNRRKSGFKFTQCAVHNAAFDLLKASLAIRTAIRNAGKGIFDAIQRTSDAIAKATGKY